MPPDFVAVVQRFGQWLLSRVHRQHGFLERVQIAVRYSFGSSNWMADFRREVADQLTQELQASEQPLPQKLLEELEGDGFFWQEYVQDWLMAQPLPPDPAAEEPESHQGKLLFLVV